MNCYTWSADAISEGIATSEHRVGRGTVLGERGRGRWEEVVALSRRSPPPLVDGRVRSASIRSITLQNSGRTIQVWSRHNKSDDRIYIRVNTSSVYTRNSSGFISSIAGDPQTVAKGNFARGAAGRIGSADDLIVAMRPGDEIRVRPEGGHKTRPSRVWIEDGKPVTAPEEDREVLLALEQDQG